MEVSFENSHSISFFIYCKKEIHFFSFKNFIFIPENFILIPGRAYKRNSNGSSALGLAALYGHAEIVEYLLNGGFDVNLRDEGNRTALHYAVLGNRIEMTKLLISKGADVDAIGKILDQKRSTPLHLAVRLGDCEVSGKMN